MIAGGVLAYSLFVLFTYLTLPFGSCAAEENW
jgi:hypothetical protein